MAAKIRVPVEWLFEKLKMSQNVGLCCLAKTYRVSIVLSNTHSFLKKHNLFFVFVVGKSVRIRVGFCKASCLCFAISDCSLFCFCFSCSLFFFFVIQYDSLRTYQYTKFSKPSPKVGPLEKFKKFMVIEFSGLKDRLTSIKS